MLEKFIKKIKIKDVFFAGVAGRRRKAALPEGVGINRIISGGRDIDFEDIEEPTPVDTIDECVIITNKYTIEKYKLFDDNKFAWHLYAADASLKLKIAGINTFVLPIRVNHLSRGNPNGEFFATAKYLLKKYNENEVYTTNGKLTNSSIFKRNLKYRVKQVFGF